MASRVYRYEDIKTQNAVILCNNLEIHLSIEKDLKYLFGYPLRFKDIDTNTWQIEYQTV